MASPSAAATHPIQLLKQQVTELEAALSLALADPDEKPVHRLRTLSRRIEAQLTLMELLPELPDHARPAAKSRKLLRKLRRAAGTVRDLDIQQSLIGDAAPKRSGNAEAEHLHKEAKSLAKKVTHERDREARLLVRTLTELQPRLARRLQKLLDALEPAEALALPPARLAELTRDWYRHHTPTHSEAEATDDPDHLHAIRKTAKLARYIAEGASDGASSAETRKLAADFESLQQSGGTWHDLLTLAAVSRKHLGRKSPLAAHFAQSCERAQKAYQKPSAGSARLNHTQRSREHQADCALKTESAITRKQGRASASARASRSCIGDLAPRSCRVPWPGACSG